MTDLDDRTLLEKWRENRDGDAFAEIARRHSPVVFDLTARVLGDRSGAEDILQEALLGLALETTAKPADVGVIAWLARFAICRARNKRSSERCRARRQIVVGSERPEDVMPEESLEHSDELEHALRGCDPEDRALLAMRFLHDWDYDRIAAALSISEGAVRVRVHRALNAVRANAEKNVGKTAAMREVAGRLAILPVAPLAASRLDAAISSTIEIAKVRLGAAPNGVEHRTASSRGFQTAVRLAGAAFALVVAVGISSIDDGTVTGAGTRGGVAASGIDVARLEDAGAREFSALRGEFGGDAADADGLRRPGARPWDWDGGALARLSDVGVARDAQTVPAPKPAVLAPADEHAAAPAIEPKAPAAAEAAAAPLDEESLDASRPSSRGTRAAKGETVSSEGERAGASGGSSTPHLPAAAAGDAEPADAAERAESDAAPRAVVRAQSGAGRVIRPAAPVVEFVPLDELPADQRALVDEAGDLLRRYLTARGDEIATGEGDATAIDAKRLRSVRQSYSKLRRAAASARPATDAPRAGRPASSGVAVGRLVSLLTRVEFGAPEGSGTILFPRGADVNSTLSEVIRVLGAATENLSVAGVPVQDPSAASAE